jgi:HK97 family phage prohead protease
VPILWQHDPYEPIGVSISLEEDRKGLFTVGQCNLDVRRGAEAHSLMRQKAIKGLSIGYQTIKDAIDGSTRRLKELDLWEYSPVTFPANQLAAVTAVKGALLREALGLDLDESDHAWAAAVAAYTKMRQAFDDASIAAPLESDGKWSVPVLDLKEGRVLSAETRASLTEAAAEALNAHTMLQALLDASKSDGAATATDEPAGAATRGIDLDAAKAFFGTHKP